MYRPKKRLFIGLLGASLLTILGLAMLIWYLFSNRENPYYQGLLIIVVGIILLIFVIVAFGIGGIVWTLVRARTVPPLQHSMRVAINLLFPIATVLGQLLGVDKERIRSSFIEVNNELVGTQQMKVEHDKIMILAPHCLQNHECPHKITIDVYNCKRCGRCQVHELLQLRDKYGISIAIATGGTLARKFIAENKPWAIVAIACERDLTSGIQDTNPLPVMGVLNIRPNGPCFDTMVDIDKVEQAIKFFLDGGQYEIPTSDQPGSISSGHGPQSIN